MEPVSTVTTAWTIVKTAGEVSKKLYDFAKNLKDRELKHQFEEILDKVRELKQSASELEDENRALRDKMRFKSEEYQFRSPYWYHKSRPDQPLCAKCFANSIEGYMGAPGQNITPRYQRCLVCGNGVEITPPSQHSQSVAPRILGDGKWM